MSANNVVDIAVLSWLTGNVILLFLFVRYGVKTWSQTSSIEEVANRMSFFTGLVCHHIGNLILLSWYWIHRTDIRLPTTGSDKWIIITGLLIATYGVFYKIRVFSSTRYELAVAAVVSLALASIYFYSIW